MEAILKFTLPEEEDLFRDYSKAMDYYCALEAFREKLRSWQKYGPIPEFSQIREEFHNLLAEINFE